MPRIRNLIDQIIYRKRRRFVSMTAAFMHKNRDVLIIIADPDTDVIMMGYGDFLTTARILDERGKKMGLVRNLLKCSKNKTYSRYINTFLHFVDGGVFNISKGLRARHKAKGRPQPEQIIKLQKESFIQKWQKKLRILKRKFQNQKSVS